MFGKNLWDLSVLQMFLEKNGYTFSEPRDLSVYFNLDLVKLPVSFARKCKTKRIRLQRKIRKLIGD